MKISTKTSGGVKKYIKFIFIVLSAIALVFVLIYIAAQNILPDLLGNTTVRNGQPISVTEEKLLDKKAPEFGVSDSAGNRIELSSFINNPVVLVFWATWNSESADQIKILDNYLINQKIQNSLIHVVSIDSLEDASIVKSFIQRGGYSVHEGLDTTGDVSNNYNIKGLPTTYFIDRDGIVREIYTGILSEGMIVDKVDNLLK